MHAARTFALLIVAGALQPAWGQNEPDSRLTTPSSASAASLGDAWKSLRDKFKGSPAPAAESADAAAPGPSASAGGEASGGAAMKLKTFTPGSKLPPNWNDTHCKNLVEPFDLTDSALSLGKLKAEAEVRATIEKLTGNGRARTDVRAEIRNAARQLNWLPLSMEVSLGQKHLEGMSGKLLGEKSASGKEAYARARRILAEQLAQIKEPYPYKFKIYVTTASGGNGESAPGGFIYVDRDLVRSAADEPKARFAIAHEVSHVLQRHRTRETQMRLSDGVDSIDDLAKLIASPQTNLQALTKKGLDLKRLFVRHSEEQELQSDGCGVRLVDASSRDRADVVKSVTAFVQSLPPATAPEPKAKTNDAAFTELLDGEYSRHPNTAQRVKNLNDVLRDLKAGK